MLRVPPNRAALVYVEELRAGHGAPLVPSGANAVATPVIAPQADHRSFAPAALTPAAPSRVVRPAPARSPRSYVPYLVAAVLVAVIAALVGLVACSASAQPQPARSPEPLDSAGDGGPHSGRARPSARARPIDVAMSVPSYDAGLPEDGSTPPTDAALWEPDGGLWCEGPTPVEEASPARVDSDVRLIDPRASDPLVPPWTLVIVVVVVALSLAIVARRRVPTVREEQVRTGSEATVDVTPDPVTPRDEARPFAIESRTGPVRSRCEDRSVVLEAGGVIGLTVADGMGGHPEGEAAAEIAVEAARRSLRRELARPDRALSLSLVARAAISASARAIVRAAPAFGYRPDDEALSTTILILLADGTEYVGACLGDGGMVVVREDGSIEPLMVAQNGPTPDVVEGCLGPSGIEGKPEVRVVPRRPGDLALIGSDGVFARVPPEFPRRMRELVVRRCSVAVAICEVLDALEALRDEQGPVADDNLTLGALWTES